MSGILRRFGGRVSLPQAADGRSFAYDRNLLPNAHLAAVDSASRDLESAMSSSGLSMGYPAWNLLYYTLLCSLTPADRDAVVVETGTNLGFSTIILAQALADSGRRGLVRTVDIDPSVAAQAKENIERAGLTEYVSFTTQDSVTYLRDLVSEAGPIDFAFLDGSHDGDVVKLEFDLIHATIVSSRGKVFFDNTTAGGVADALEQIRHQYGGNLVEFENCSWSPPGNAVWQPS